VLRLRLTFEWRKVRQRVRNVGLLSAGWCDPPRGKAKHDFFWNMLFGPHNFTVWRHRIPWPVRSPDFTTSEYSLWLDLEIEVCATHPDLPKHWKSALQREMGYIILSDWSKLYRNSDGHDGQVSNFRELIYTLCAPFRVRDIARVRNVSILSTRDT